MNDKTFENLMMTIHKEKPLTGDQRKQLQKIINSDEYNEFFYLKEVEKKKGEDN